MNSKIIKHFLGLTLIFFGIIAHAKQWIDLTHALNAQVPYMPAGQGFHLKPLHHQMTRQGFFYAENAIQMPEHIGTHIDAPLHFAAHGETIAAIPLKNLLGEAVRINVQAYIKQCNTAISVAALKQWEKQYGKITPNNIVLIETGYENFWPDRKKYLGTNAMGRTGVQQLCFPGLSLAAAQWLVQQRQVKLVGIDTASIDVSEDHNFPVHRYFAAQKIPVIENLANLNRLPAKNFQVYALPLKISEGTGAPARVVAEVK